MMRAPLCLMLAVRRCSASRLRRTP